MGRTGASDGPDLSVVVPSYESAETVEACIAGLLDQDIAPDRFEVLFVDNNSTDGSDRLIADHGPRVQLLREERQGAYAARNRALQDARGRVIVFTDPDCVPERGWLRAALAGIETGVEIVVGRNLAPEGSGGLRLLMLYEHHKDRFALGHDDPTLYYGHTNNMAVTRATLERFGPFLERSRGADTIFVRTVVDALGPGAVRYDDAMRVTHLEVADLATYFRKVFTYGRSRRRYQAIMRTRPLTTGERVEVFRSVCRGEGLSPFASGWLLSLLVTGVGFWNTGALAGSTGDPDGGAEGRVR